jgi:hypothetical protein
MTGDRVLRVRLREENYRYYRRLEECARRWLPRTVSFVRFVSLCVWASHRHTLSPGVAYEEIYWRDGHRCTNPVCTSRNATPHHLQFRSRGGDDTTENVTTLCAECHIGGVHEGRISVDPPASDMHWRIGEDGGLEVRGRRVVRDVA